MNAPARQFRPRSQPSPKFTPAGDEALILSAYFHPEPTGSAPPITDLAFWLAEHGGDVTVATARPSYPRREVFEGYRNGERDRELINGVKTRRVAAYVSPSGGTVGRLRTELSVAARLIGARLRGEIKRSRNVICVCPSTFVVAVAPLFRARDGRLLCIVHDLQSGLAKSLGFGMGGALLSGLRAFERWAFNRCDVLVALSEEMAAEIDALGVKPPIVVIPPQVDVREITPQPEPAGPATLLYSGNLGRKQGLDQILALAAELQKRGRNVPIVIRGEGSERAELEAAIAEAELTNVRIEGLAARDRLSSALAEGVIHLAPQNPEGASFALPSKIFSIMAAQRPFLATARPRTPLHRLARESGAGLCVPPYDASALADAAEALIDDGARRRSMGAAGRTFVERFIDREVVCRALWYALTNPAQSEAEPLDRAAQQVAAERRLASMPSPARASIQPAPAPVESRSFAREADEVLDPGTSERDRAPARRGDAAPTANA